MTTSGQRCLLPLLAACLMTVGTAWAQREVPSPESAACDRARRGLEHALQAHVVNNTTSSVRLEAARRQAQAACLGGDATTTPGRRVAPQPPFAVPDPPLPAARMPAPAVALPLPSVPLPSPRVLGPCDATGCWDNQGRRLNEGGGIYSAPGGGVCSVQGVFATCP